MKYLAAWLVGFCLLTSSASAHALGESYVFISVNQQELEGRFEISTKDLRDRFGIEVGAKEDPILQLQATAGRIQQYIREHASIGPEANPFSLEFTGVQLLGDWDNGWAQYLFKTPAGDTAEVIDIHLALLFEFDRRHRNLLLVEHIQKTGQSFDEKYAFVFSPDHATQQLDLTKVPKLLGARAMILEGIWHIWLGIDHILFIFAFLFPTVLMWNKGNATWEPVANFAKAFGNVLTAVTVFTVAHSITLGLAALDYIRVSSRLVESAIALSIVLVAVGNMRGGRSRIPLIVIFGLGLFHGLGFASVLGHLPFRMVDALKGVVGFNIGVELGQLAVVALVFPVLFAIRRNPKYPTLVIRGASAVLALVAGYWFVVRAFGNA